MAEPAWLRFLSNEPPEIELLVGPDGREHARLRRDPPAGEIATYAAWLFNSMAFLYPPRPDDVLVTEHGEVIRNPTAAARKAVLAVLDGDAQQALTMVFMTGATMGVHPVKTQLEQHQGMLAGARTGGRKHRKVTPELAAEIRAEYARFGDKRGAHAAVARKFGISPTQAKKYRN